jgi:hypothetical protein
VVSPAVLVAWVRRHLALPAEKVRDPVNREVIFCAAGVLSATPLTYSLHRDDSDFVCSALPSPKTRRLFLNGSAGSGWRRARDNLKTSGRPERVVQDERKAEEVRSSRRIGPIDGQRCSL